MLPLIVQELGTVMVVWSVMSVAALTLALIEPMEFIRIAIVIILAPRAITVNREGKSFDAVARESPLCLSEVSDELIIFTIIVLL